MHALMGALLGTTHPAVAAYVRFIRRYSRMLTRLEFDIDHAHGCRLDLSIMTSYIHMAWRNCIIFQLDGGGEGGNQSSGRWCRSHHVGDTT
jgi:hypothetical protein